MLTPRSLSSRCTSRGTCFFLSLTSCNVAVGRRSMLVQRSLHPMSMNATKVCVSKRLYVMTSAPHRNCAKILGAMRAEITCSNTLNAQEARDVVRWEVRYNFIKISMKLSLFVKNHFHQKPLSSNTTFIQNHFHQKPLSSKTIFEPKTQTRP